MTMHTVPRRMSILGGRERGAQLSTFSREYLHAHIRVARVYALDPPGCLCSESLPCSLTSLAALASHTYLTSPRHARPPRSATAPDQLARATTNDLELDAAIPAPATLPAHPPFSPSLYRLPPAPPCFLPSPTTVLRSTVSTFLATCIHENFLKASSWARCTIARRRSSYSGKLV